MGIKMDNVSFDERWMLDQLQGIDKKYHATIKRTFYGGIRYILNPKNGRKSFYGKANMFVFRSGRNGSRVESFLVSYSTIVSVLWKGKVVRLGKWTNTTSIHQKTYEEEYNAL